MGEQERYTKLLKKVIEETERNKIQSAEDVIHKLIMELSSSSVKIPVI